MDIKEKNDKSFLGRGWSFPPTFLKQGIEKITMVENEKDISESLEILLSTNLGERIMLPDYGCDLRSYLFDSINNTRLNFLKELIKTAIIKYESRVDLHNVWVETSEYLDGILKISLDYTIITTNTRFNLVFPYYKIEGTDIPQLYRQQISETLSTEE